jgi:hypothetical protein
LPAAGGESITLSETASQELNEFWHPRGSPRTKARSLPVPNDRPLNLLQLELTEGSSFVPASAKTVAQRRVGRGRVMVTAFSISDRGILDWGSFDAFLHGCLLGKPPREFFLGEINHLPDVRYPSVAADERLIASGLRYASRDAVGVWQPPAENSSAQVRNNEQRPLSRDPEPAEGDWQLAAEARPYGGFRSDQRYGTAGWSDFSAMADAARASLRAAAGIDVPSRRFVLKVLGLYLLCLVPGNWIIFRMMGRVEWAWFAAPLIAILGAVGVIRSAQLDIGFARSHTELGVLEIQPNYPRGHLTRFIGLYTSLTTNYNAVQADRSALFLPFSTDPADDELRLAAQREAVYAELQRDKVSLSGFQVVSNTTGMLHCESYLDLPNAPTLTQASLSDMRLENASGFPWYSPIVLLRTEEGVRAAVVDKIDDGTSRKLVFGEPGDAAAIVQQLNTSPVTSQTTPKGVVSLRTLVKIAGNVSSLQLGESRMIAWTDYPLPGMEITPQSNQRSSLTLIVAHLHYADPPAPQADYNLRSEIEREKG